MKDWAHRTGWDHRFQQQIRFIPDSNNPGGTAWVIPIAHSHWKTKSAQAMLIAESTPSLQLQKHKAVLPASNRKEENVDQKLQPARGWRNWSSLLSPEHHWLQRTGKRRQDIRSDRSRAALLMDNCWQGFLLESRSLYWLSWLLIPPGDRFCGSTALCNSSHAAGSWGDSLASLLQSVGESGCKRSRHCLVAHTCPTAMAWLGLLESELGTSQLWIGLFQKKLCSVKPLVCVSQPCSLQPDKGNNGATVKKPLFLGVPSVLTNFSTKVHTKQEAEFSPTCAHLSRYYYQGYSKVNGVSAKISTHFTLWLLPGVPLFQEE